MKTRTKVSPLHEIVSIALLVTLTLLAGCSKTNQTPVPSIASISPISGPIGTTVTLSGANFSTTASSDIVKFDGTAASITAVSSTSITTTVPTGASTGPVTLTTNGGTTSGPVFTIISAPTVTSIFPTSGPAGTSVTITGTNFSTTASDNLVSFGGSKPSTVTAASTTSLTVTVPADATTGPIGVGTIVNVIVAGVSIPTSGGIAVGPSFSVTSTTPLPTITTISPTSGSTGTTVTITGTNFSTTALSNTVTFNGISGSVTAATSAGLTVIVPTGATTGVVDVSVGGQIVVGPTFTVTAAAAVNIYVVGATNNNSSNGIAKIWKNGVATSLTDGSNDAHAYSVFLSSTDVYVAGSDGFFAEYWKNGVATKLTDGTGTAYAHSIYVSGTDVFVAGVVGAGVATLWKNGVATNLTDGSDVFADANSVFVNGTDVYVAGRNNNKAVVWKNGAATALTDGTNIGEAFSIVVNGSDVYAAGSDGSTAKYWKNGVATSLTDGSNLAVARSIAIDNSGGVFVSFTDGNLAKSLAYGSTVTLTNGSSQAFANAIAVNGTDVYVAGVEGNSDEIWINGIATSFASACYILSIAVK